MTARPYDLVVVGGGSAGLTAAGLGAALGARVALLDRERLGGECLWTGCVPSKALIAAAGAAQQARELAALGLSGRLDPVDLGQVMDRVQAVIHTIAQGENAETLRARGIDVHFGDVRFTSPHILAVTGQELRGRAFLLCTGSSPAVPAIDGLAESGYLTNETIFGLRRLPEHLIVVGGGPIGVELAQAFRRLGSAVTIVSGERGLLPREDDEVRRAVADLFHREGIAVHRGRLAQVARTGDDAQVTCSITGSDAVLRGDTLLLAVGRRPNVAGLGLEQAGVQYDVRRGINVDTYLRTSTPHIFACGDVTGPYQFTHAAGFQAATAVRNALFPWAKGKSRLDPMPWTTFTDPEVARVGLTEAEARHTHGHVLVLRSSFAHNDRAQTEGRAEGFVKLIVTPWRGRILGAHIVGPQAGELLQEVTLAMRTGQNVRALSDTLHVYPTLSLAVQQAALGFYKQWPLARLAGAPLRALAHRARE